MKISKLKTLIVALAAIAAIPSAMAKPSGSPQGGNSGLPRPNGFQPFLYPFICNMFGPPTPVNAFSGYINIAGQKGLIIDLQTSTAEPCVFPQSTAGTFTLPTLPTYKKIRKDNPANRFTGLDFYLQGYCNDDGCSGPWVFVQAYAPDDTPIVGASVVCASNFPGMAGCCHQFSGDTTTFTKQCFTNASFNFPAKGVSLAGVIIQLFPGCDGNHDTRIRDMDINGARATFQTPRTIYNYCPLGFALDPRPTPCNANNLFYGCTGTSTAN